MHILIYNWRDLAHPYAGGAEVYTDRVATEWVRQGHKVTLFTSASPGLPEVEVAHGGYAIVRRGTRHGVYREARRYWKREGKGKFDLVVDEVNTRPFGCPRFVDGVPVIALIHQVCREIWDYETKWPVSWLGKYILEPLWLRSYRHTSVVTVSESSRRSLLDYGITQVTVVPEGMDAVEEIPGSRQKEEKPTLIFVGRLTRNKRPQEALRVFEVLSRMIPGLQMWIVGGGPEETRLMASAPDGVQFVGRCSEQTKRELLGRAHVLVATSVREGWGLVVSEAAREGTVSCAYDVAGLRDSVIASGGMLSGEDPFCLANVARELMERSLRGEAAPRLGGVVPWDEVAGRILALVAGNQGAFGERVANVVVGLPIQTGWDEAAS